MNIIKIIVKAVCSGIKDYYIDTRHDHILRQVHKIGCKMYCPMGIYDTKKKKGTRKWGEAYSWKEGNLFHYIGQRYYFLSEYGKMEI